jgi:hypothetical protein
LNGFAVLGAIVSDPQTTTLVSSVEEAVGRGKLDSSRQYGIRNLLEAVPAIREVANST